MVMFVEDLHWLDPSTLELEQLLAEQGASVDRGVAEKQYRKAIEVAQHRWFKWWELRATSSLAGLLVAQGRRDDARVIL